MLTYERKKLSIILIIILAVAALVYGAVYLLCVKYISASHVQSLIVSEAEKKLNRKVSLSEQIGFGIGWDLSPNIKLYKISIANSSWSSHPTMLAIEELDIHFSLTKLLFKKFHIIYLRLDKPVLYLESKGNQNNWDFGSSYTGDSKDNVELSISKIRIFDGEAYYAEDKYDIDRLTLAVADATDFDFHIVGKRNSLPFKASVDLESTGNQININIDNIQVGSSDLEGKLNIQKGAKSISGEINSKHFKYRDFSSVSSNPEYTVPSEVFPILHLKGGTVDITANIKTLDVVGLQFTNVVFKNTMQNNVLQIQLQPGAKIAGGTLDLNINYDINVPTPAASLRVKTSTLQLETMLVELMGKSPLSDCSFNFETNLSGSGDNLHAIVSSFNGHMLATVGPGRFLNSRASLGNVFTTVLTSIISFDKTAPSTAITCGVLNFKVNNGIATAKNGIGIEAASVRVLGDGMLDLRNGRINFIMNPQTTANIINQSNFSMAQLVQVTGTIKQPQAELNPAALISSTLTSNMAIAGLAGGLPGIAAMAIAEKAFGSQTNGSQISPCKAALGS